MSANEKLEMEVRDRQNLKIQCEGWLKPPNVRAIHQSQVQAKLHGTCGWIWLNPTFKEWSEPSPSHASDRFLCISGTHGCGKSVLASSIVDDLQKRDQQTLFFSFSGTDTGRQSFDCFIRSFLWQLLQSTIDEKSLNIVRGLMLRGPPLVSELWTLFKAVAALVSAPVYCIIDGIDECCYPTETLLNHILELVSAHINFRAVLLGRPPLLQAATRVTSRTIEIDSDLIKQDIDAYIDAEIGKHEIFKLPQLRDTVVEVLKEKSEGMFLWVKLMIDDLCKSDTLAQVKERLRDLPRGLEKAYRLYFSRLVEQLDTYELALARSVFIFTITSRRPLEVEELRHAYATHCGDSALFEECLLVQPDRRILNVCGGLINITNDIVRPIHLSLKEYLTRPEDEWLRSNECEIMAFRVDLEASHGSLGSICVDYLTMCQYGSPLSDTDNFLELGVRYPFLKYASLYAASHLSRSGPLCSAIVYRIRDFLRSENCAPWIEYFGMLVLEEASVVMLYDEVERFISWLNKAEYEPELLGGEFLIRVNQELENRTRKFGEHDPRTEQWKLFLDLFLNDNLNADAGKDIVPESQSRTLQTVSSGPSSLSHILNALNSNSTLPLHRQVDMLLRLQSHLQYVRVLTDPLKMLFRIILQKAPIIPVYVLVAIGAFYFKMNKLEEALEVFRAGLAKVASQEIPIKFVITTWTGCILGQQKKYVEAEAIFWQTLKAKERLLGKEHKETLQSAYRLACLLSQQTKYQEAEAIHRRTLETRGRVLGKEHVDTLKSSYRLGCVLRLQGKYEEAEAIHRQTLTTRERVLGREHKDTLWSASELARVLRKQEKYKETEAIFRRVLEVEEKLLGKEHKDTLQSTFDVARALADQKKYGEAEVIFRRVLDAEERVLGKEHKRALWDRYSLALVLRKQGKREEAEAICSIDERLTLEENTPT